MTDYGDYGDSAFNYVLIAELRLGVVQPLDLVVAQLKNQSGPTNIAEPEAKH